MEYKEKKYIVRKLMQNALTEEEQTYLSASKPVSELMEQQWENVEDSSSRDSSMESTLLKKINTTLDVEKNQRRRIGIYKCYSLVSSLLLIIGLLSFSYYVWQSPASMYVVSSGVQNIETVVLPDGTNVLMGPGSRLTYPVCFKGGKRMVQLNGQAFFDVAQDRKHPFVVQTQGMDIEALGTAFEVFNYEKDKSVETVLVSGKIKVAILADEEGTVKSTHLVSSNEKITLNRESQEVSKQKVDASRYTAWYNQKMLCFQNEKLSMIIPRLEKWYGRNIICPQELLEKYRFTFKVRDESLDRILFIMQRSSQLKYEEKDNGDYILSLK